jgi:hypothetical protein
MPYCWKCGSKLEQDDKYCHVCGTPVGGASAGAYAPHRAVRRRGWSPLYSLAVVLVSILIVGTIVSVFVFLPVQQVNFGRTEQIAAESGVRAVWLNLTADVSTFNITFVDPLTVTVAHSRSGHTMQVDATIERNGLWWPLFGGLNVVCDVQVERSLNVSLVVKTSVGGVVLVAQSGVVLDSLDLETDTGGVEVSLGRGVVLNGPVVVQSTTGSSSLSWDRVRVTGSISVDVKTTTGGVNVDISQDSLMNGNVTLNGETVTGGVDFSIVIHDDVGATVNSATTVGGVSTDLTRFSGNTSPLNSENYPASSNFLVTLKTVTGGINVNATYEPGQHM